MKKANQKINKNLKKIKAIEILKKKLKKRPKKSNQREMSNKEIKKKFRIAKIAKNPLKFI